MLTRSKRNSHYSGQLWRPTWSFSLTILLRWLTIWIMRQPNQAFIRYKLFRLLSQGNEAFPRWWGKAKDQTDKCDFVGCSQDKADAEKGHFKVKFIILFLIWMYWYFRHRAQWDYWSCYRGKDNESWELSCYSRKRGGREHGSFSKADQSTYTEDSKAK